MMQSIATVGHQEVRVPDLATMVHIDYVNYRGERRVRQIVPQRIYFGDVEWHPGAQWILDAWDVDKAALRSFALGDIRSWGV
jgi:predicted DNA-binding transcriptional regulator YafY